MIAINTGVTEKSKAKEEPLLFAAIIRVSTERQAKKGESLLTQKNDIEESVARLGGKIVEWYGGQEHATPGFEKKEIDRLIRDAQKKKFNAVICTNADRWSRDNKKSQEGLDVFKKCGTRFFIGTSECDLYNPDHCLYLGISTVIGQFQSSNQKRKSIENRIHRAKRGLPTCGKKPYGRIWDKKTETWSIDKEKQQQIFTIAKRYLEGEHLCDLADEYGVNAANLHKTLNFRCGDTWEQNFECEALKINDKVTINIPRLLPDDMIKAIRKKAVANRTYTHGKIKYPYLLRRVIFCKHCGYAMFGQTNHNKHQYYRHAHTKRVRKCDHSKGWIQANILEDMVIRYLVECFGNPMAVQKAIEKAIPNLERMKEYQKRIKDIEHSLTTIKNGKDTILRLISKGLITEKEAEKQLCELKQRENKLQTEQQQLHDNLENVPNSDSIKAFSKSVSTQFRHYQLKINTIKWVASNQPYDKMTHEEKRALVEMVFSGKMSDGKRMGVYIEWNSRKDWNFDIHGHLMDENGLIPMSKSRIKAACPFEEEGYSGRKQKELLTKYVSYCTDRIPLLCHFLSGTLRPAA